MRPIRLAIIGYGRFGRVHALRARVHADFDLRCVIECDPALRHAAQRDGFQALASLCELPHDVQAAVVVTPSSTHARIACELMERGIDVLVEKPFATSEQDICMLLQTAAHTGRILVTGHIERFNHALRGTLWDTPPDRIEIERHSCRASHTDGAVLDLMVHDIDLARNLLTAVDAIPCTVVDAGHSRHNGVHARLRMGSTMVHLSAHYAASQAGATIAWEHRSTRRTLSLRSSIDTGPDHLSMQYTAFFQRLTGQDSRIASALDGAFAARNALVIESLL